MGITIHNTDFTDVLLIKPEIFEDHRGVNVEIYNMANYETNNIAVKFVRDNISASTKDVLRGVHYDNKTWKLIHCMFGKIYLVIVDMRTDSTQFLKWQSFILTSSTRHHILLPPGFANGHLALSEYCIFHYKMSEYYDPENEIGIRWDDPKINIFWPIKHPVLSQKDSTSKYLM